MVAVGCPAFRGIGHPDFLYAGVEFRRKGGLCDRDLFADDDRLFVGQRALCRTARRHVGRSARTHGARRVQDGLCRRRQYGGRAGSRSAGEGFPAVGGFIGELDRGDRRRGRCGRLAVLRDVRDDAGADPARADGTASGIGLAARPATQQAVADPCRCCRMPSGVQCVPGERYDLFLQVLRGWRNCRDDVVRRGCPDRIGSVPRCGAAFQYCGHRADSLRCGSVRPPADAGMRFAAHGRFQFRLLFRASGRLFPAVSGAWNIAEEPFIKKHLKWMNMFKVRFSYGKVGNDNVGTRFPYLYTIADRYKNGDNEIIYGGYDWAQYPSSYSFGGLGFADVASNGITWEVAEKNDLGIDLALFNDKFTATIDYFDEKRTGIYMVRNYLPQIVGLNGHNPAANVGAVSSKGFDGHFSYKQRINDVNLTVRGNITYSKNEVLERDEENNVYAYQMQRGYRVDQCKGLIAEGLFKDYDDIRNSPTQSWGKVQPGDIKYRDVNGDGVINDGDQVAIGATSRPNLIYGLGASASWKGLDVNVHFQGAGKSTFFTYGKCVWAFTEGEWGNIFKGMLDNRWVDADTAETLGIPANENPNASYPRLSYQGDNASNNNYRNSTFWLKNGRYLRLKTIDVGYTLPKSIVNKMHFNNIRIFLVGTNLLTWSSFKTWDPEMGDPRGESYPLTKSITMGISVNL